MTSLIDRIREGRTGTATLPPAERSAPPGAAAPLPAGLPPAAACSCGSAAFWINAYGALLCDRCAPPSSPAMVRNRLFAAGGTWLTADEYADRQKNNFPPPMICESCDGNIFYLDYDGNFFCRHCWPPQSSPQKIFAVCLNADWTPDRPPEEKFRWEDFHRPKLKTVLEISRPQEIAYFEEMKKRADEYRQKFAANASEALETWKGVTVPAGKKTSGRRR